MSDGCGLCFTCQKCVQCEVQCGVCYSCERCFACEVGAAGEPQPAPRGQPQPRQQPQPRLELRWQPRPPAQQPPPQPLTEERVKEIVLEILEEFGLVRRPERRRGINLGV